MCDEYTMLDISGLICPIDVIRTAKALRQIDDGDILKVISKNPLVWNGDTIPTALDLTAFCRTNNHKIIKQKVSHDEILMYIQKNTSSESQT